MPDAERQFKGWAERRRERNWATRRTEDLRLLVWGILVLHPKEPVDDLAEQMFAKRFQREVKAGRR